MRKFLPFFLILPLLSACERKYTNESVAKRVEEMSTHSEGRITCITTKVAGGGFDSFPIEWTCTHEPSGDVYRCVNREGFGCIRIPRLEVNQ